MKIILTSILIFLTLFIYGQKSDFGYLFINENTIPLDKQEHAAAGLYLGTTAYMVFYQGKDGNRKRARLWGIIIPIVGGLTKELIDINTTGFNVSDLGYTVAGGVVATFTWDFLMKQKHKNKTKSKIPLVN